MINNLWMNEQINGRHHRAVCSPCQAQKRGLGKLQPSTQRANISTCHAVGDFSNNQIFPLLFNVSVKPFYKHQDHKNGNIF